MSFASLGLSQPILRAIAAQGYSVPTPIQVQAIPHVLSGRDLRGCAQTGTGKTAAFALPILDRLHLASSDHSSDRSDRPAPRPVTAHGPSTARRPNGFNGPRQTGGNPRCPIRCLILAPTRELAAQIGESFATYGQFSGLRSTVIYGGVGQGSQTRALRDGVDILVATPGRLLDLMEQGFVHLQHVEVLILDEADQMLDMGFLPALQRIVAQVPRNRQTLLFSATMPPEIRRLADTWLNDPVEVNVAPSGTTVDLIEQEVFHVDSKDKPQLLVQLLNQSATGRTLVFTRTKHGADKVVKKLVQSGIRAEAIHGNKSQNQRQRALDAFRSERPPVLVATDIAARGLDIDAIAHVINYDMPLVAEIYVHRIGRTGRAGADGIAVSLCARDERDLLRQIERLTRRPIRVKTFELARQSAATPADSPTSADHGHRPSQPRPHRPAGAGAGAGGRQFKHRRPDRAANSAGRRSR